MKKNLLLMIFVSFVLVACAVKDEIYGTGKVIYKGAKTIYVELPYENEKLELLDKVLVTYDKARSVVKDEIGMQKKTLSSSKVQ